jgi:protein gp37
MGRDGVKMNKTNIEYLDYTWNPIAMRCAPVSEACENCWHLAAADRLARNPKIDREIRASYSGEMPHQLVNYRLEEPLKLKKPSVIGVQFMGDLFHDYIFDDCLQPIFNTMVECQQHIFLLLTKRPGNMKDWIELAIHAEWPIDNLWLGVTAENQKRADERIPILLQIPAAVRFVSVEPMLEPINMTEAIYGTGPRGMNAFGFTDGFGYEANIQWVICGAETGSGARWMNPEWAFDLYAQCHIAGVPFFFKKASKGDTIDLPREYPNSTR